ncbi:MAG: D-alanine--D-alanine ligase [Candidatus Omnitrophota bacterium]
MAVEKKFGRVGVLMGGPSTEREVSLKSGKSVYEALKQASLDTVSIDIVTDNVDEDIKLISSYDLDCAFLALHGRFGEDGTIQEILDYLGIPYTGSGAMASRLSMDKVISRKVLEVYGLAVPKYKVIKKDLYNKNDQLRNNFVFPMVAKPATHGSSIGLSIIDKPEELIGSIDLAFKYDDTIVLEEFIAGRELTVGILDNKALPVVEIIPRNRFFDYEAKYHQGMTEYRVPASIDETVVKKVQAAALKTHQLLGCFGCSRVDIILGKDNSPYVLELNSIPGFTPTSLLPKAAKSAGIEFNELCLRLIELAYEKAKNQVFD